MIPLPFHRILATALATLFFVFQTELDHDEYQRQHRLLSSSPAFAAPSLTWETFDKENAQKAFVLPVERGDVFILLPHHPIRLSLPPQVSLHPIRDKSPPHPAHTSDSV